jgi:uncharacterized protein
MKQINFEELWKSVEIFFPYLDTSWIHGIDHFKNVEKYGLAIAETTKGVDETVVRLFSMFHDTKRENDKRDPEHGYRASLHIMQNLQGKVFSISQRQLELLTFAITFHSSNFTTPDPTIGACWDADRCDLNRFGKAIDYKFLSTNSGKSLAIYINKKLLTQRKKEIEAALAEINLPAEENSIIDTQIVDLFGDKNEEK